MKTSKKDFEYFKERCQYWMDLFNLNDWEMFFKYVKHKHYNASMQPDFEARQIVIEMSEVLVDMDRDNFIDYLSFHEVCHVLLADISGYGYAYFSKASIVEEQHKIIGKLYHSIFEAMR